MEFFWSKFATDKNRWIALVFLALSLAIVIIDNTVLNIAIPYILRDLNTSLDGLQWVISGYALIIATLLITVGRLGDMFGRKKIFLIGIVLFAIGSFIASISTNVAMLFVGEAFIEAIGASMMMTSSLSLLATEFQGKERSIAFGVWGSVAGVSAAFGPLLGGYLTTYYSWRWSLRINVAVAIIAILGSIFVKEAKGKARNFDFLGTIFSGVGLFSLIFGFIEGRKFGWFAPNEIFSIGNFHWPFSNISIVPFSFVLAVIFLTLFGLNEYFYEKKGRDPLLKLSIFKNKGFSIGLLTLTIFAFGQIGTFFILPIYLQNVLNLTAFQTGIVFLPSTLIALVIGPFSGIIASKVGPKWIVTFGMAMITLGTFFLRESIAINIGGWSLVPAFIFYGVGIGMASSQVTNIIISSVPITFAGEASAVNATVRQIGASIGIAIIGVIFASSITYNLSKNINSDTLIPSPVKEKIVSGLSSSAIETGKKGNFQGPKNIQESIKNDVNDAIVESSKEAFQYALLAVLLGTLFSFLIPQIKHSVEKK